MANMTLQEKIDELLHCIDMEMNGEVFAIREQFDRDEVLELLNQLAEWVRRECAEAINQYPLFKDVPELVAYNDTDKFGALAYERSELQRLILNAGK